MVNACHSKNFKKNNPAFHHDKKIMLSRNASEPVSATTIVQAKKMKCNKYKNKSQIINKCLIANHFLEHKDAQT